MSGAPSGGLHDPGFVYFGAALPKDGKLDAAREALLAAVESLKREPVRDEEVERARTSLLNDFEKTQLDTAAYVRALSEFAAMGDWRLFFLYRERLKKVATADVQRVAEHYLKPANRVVGAFIPTEAPDRADIPPSRDWQAALDAYKADGAGRAPGRGFRSVAEEHRVARGAQEPVERHARRAPAEEDARRARGGDAARCTGATRKASSAARCRATSPAACSCAARRRRAAPRSRTPSTS